MGKVLEFRRKEKPLRELIYLRLETSCFDFLKPEIITEYLKKIRAMDNIELLIEYEAKMPFIKRYEESMNKVP